jgi:predicted DNA-binding transcriptional regulator AlpA
MEVLLKTPQEVESDTNEPERLVAVIPGFLTKEATAVFLGKSVATLDRWHRLRVGPPRTKIGSSTFYRKAALDAWIVAQEQDSLRSGR